MNNEDAIRILLNSNEYHHAKGDLPHSAASIEAFNKAIDALKAERPKGEWIKGREISRTMLGYKVEHIDYKDYTCSNCGLVLDNLLYYYDGSPFYKFCPNCGADMRGDI